MLARSARNGGIGAILLLILLVASCSVSPAGPGTPASVSFTLLGRTVTITFGPVGRVQAEKDQTVTQSGVVRLFDEAPSTRPPTGTMRLLGSSVSADGPINAKSAARSQTGNPVNGTASVRFFVAPGESATACTTGTLLASYELSVVAGIISVLDDVADMSDAALDAVMANDVTICIEVTANFSGLIVFDQFSFSFGGGSGADGGAGTASFTLVNNDFENIHILLPGEEFNDALNRITPGNVRNATMDVSIGDVITVRAGRGGVVLSTTTCPTVTDSDYTATATWDGIGVVCEAEQSDDGGGGSAPPVGSSLQVPIDSPGGVAVAVPPTETYNDIDYAIVGVLGDNTLGSPVSPYPLFVTIDLASLGLSAVDEMFMAVYSAWVPDLGNGVTLATLSCDYAEGGAPTTLAFTLGSTTAEWSYNRPEHTSLIGGVPHDPAPVLYSYPSTGDSAFEYMAQIYDVSLPMDSSRTLTSCLFTAVSSDTFPPRPLVPEPTWSGTAILGMTLVGPSSGTGGVGIVFCDEQADCAADEICTPDGVCIPGDFGGGVPVDECSSDANCPSGQTCVGGVCVPDTPGCTSSADCGPDETCVDGTCVPGPGEDGFTTPTIIRRGAEHLIAGPDADPNLSLQSPAGYAPGPFGTKSVALSGDGGKVWVALFDQFPNVEGDPQTQLWSINTDGTGGARSSLPVEDMRNGMHVATNIDGSVVVADNPQTTRFYRATPGTGVSELFDYAGIGDPRGLMRISDDASQLIYVNFSLGNMAVADISAGTATPQVLTTTASLITNGLPGTATIFELDISSSAERWMVGTRTFDPDPFRNRWPIFIGNGLSAPTISMVTTERDDLAFSRFNMTDDGQTIAYCRATEFNGLIGRCYIQSVGSAARTEIVDEVENLGNLSLSDDGSKAYMSTSVGSGGGQGFIYDVATGERYTGGSQWFADSSTPDFTSVEWSDDGRLLMSAISRGIYVLHDGSVPAGFPTIDRILYRMNDEDCSMTVRVEVNAPLGIERIFTLPFYQGLEASRGVIPGAENPLFRERSGGGVNKSTTFTQLEAGVWERQIILTNDVGVCASSFLNSDFSIRIVLVEETTTRTVFQDFSPVSGGGGGADCSSDGACNADCGETDPDCAEVCVADGFCNVNCSDLDPDPDCSPEPTGEPRCTMSSSFDIGDEGWLILGDAQGGRGEPDYVASGGNPGGHISAKDDAQGGVWFFQAPVAHRGNFSGALGKTLTFDLKQSSLSSQFDGIDVSLAGGGLTIVADAGPNPGTDWTSYSIALDTSAGWTLDALGGTPATQADILAVLTDLNDMLIRGEFVSGADTGGLDNVVLNSDCP